MDEKEIINKDFNQVDRENIINKEDDLPIKGGRTKEEYISWLVDIMNNEYNLPFKFVKRECDRDKLSKSK